MSDDELMNWHRAEMDKNTALWRGECDKEVAFRNEMLGHADDFWRGEMAKASAHAWEMCAAGVMIGGSAGATLLFILERVL